MHGTIQKQARAFTSVDLTKFNHSLIGRYLLVEFVFSSAEDGNTALVGATPRNILDAVKESILSLHGDYGLASVQHSLNIKYLNAVTRVMIVRCPRDQHKAVWSAITTITSLKRTPCAAHVIHVGGTIRSCQRALVKYNQQKLKEMIETTSNPGRCGGRSKVRSGLKGTPDYSSCYLMKL